MAAVWTTLSDKLYIKVRPYVHTINHLRANMEMFIPNQKVCRCVPVQGSWFKSWRLWTCLSSKSSQRCAFKDEQFTKLCLANKHFRVFICQRNMLCQQTIQDIKFMNICLTSKQFKHHEWNVFHKQKVHTHTEWLQTVQDKSFTNMFANNSQGKSYKAKELLKRATSGHSESTLPSHGPAMRSLSDSSPP